VLCVNRLTSGDGVDVGWPRARRFPDQVVGKVGTEEKASGGSQNLAGLDCSKGLVSGRDVWYNRVGRRCGRLAASSAIQHRIQSQTEQRQNETAVPIHVRIDRSGVVRVDDHSGRRPEAGL
jgi:hypothetical protein